MRTLIEIWNSLDEKEQKYLRFGLIGYTNGAMLITTNFEHNAYTIGNIITIDKSTPPETINHEFGHDIQSQRFGIFWLPVFALPSIIRNAFYFGTTSERYNKFYTEHYATDLGNKYFKD